MNKLISKMACWYKGLLTKLQEIRDRLDEPLQVINKPDDCLNVDQCQDSIWNVKIVTEEIGDCVGIPIKMDNKLVSIDNCATTIEAEHIRFFKTDCGYVDKYYDKEGNEIVGTIVFCEPLTLCESNPPDTTFIDVTTNTTYKVWGNQVVGLADVHISDVTNNLDFWAMSSGLCDDAIEITDLTGTINFYAVIA